MAAKVVEENKQLQCYAKSYRYEESGKPAKAVEISMLPCPGTGTSGVNCEDQEYIWRCCKCKEALLFGFDKYLYCSCGRAKADTFYFKCTSENHKNTEYLGPQKPWILNKFLKEIKPLNILMLGQTGVGKSTWLNSFINYLLFPSMEAAEQGTLRFATSSTFEFTDSNYKSHKIDVTVDNNENSAIGRSATKEVRGHNFVLGNTWIRFIDTPGIIDTEGLLQDKENIHKVLMYLKDNLIEELHGICILQKSTDNRLNVTYEFCLKELLSYLHKDATKNIVFCFTHSKATSFLPGDVTNLLKEIKKLEDFNVPLNRDTMYFVDNEAFRYLAAKKIKGKELYISEDIKGTSAISWKKSVEETDRLIAHFKGLQPHAVEETLWLYEARNYMIYLTKPLVDISQVIQENLARIKYRRQYIESLPESQRRGKLHVDIINLDIVKLEYPRTVCSADGCVEYHKVDDFQIEAVYRQVCHKQCHLKSVPEDIIGDSRIQNCWAMAHGRRKDCRVCRHMWDKHLHIKYKLQRSIKKLSLLGRGNVMNSYQEFLEQTTAFVRELEGEQSKIFEVSVKVGKFLKDNATIPYNNVVGKYIDLLIKQEEKKAEITLRNESIGRLKVMKEMFLQEEAALTQARKGKIEERFELKDVEVLLKELYSLRHNGKQLKRAFEYSYKLGRPRPVAYDKLHVMRPDPGKFLSCSPGNEQFQ